MTKYKVIGPLEVAGKSTGEIVDLDPEAVNVPALIEGGHVEPMVRPEFSDRPAPKPVTEESEPATEEPVTEEPEPVTTEDVS